MKLCVKKDSLDTLGTWHQASARQVQWQVGKASANNVPEGSGDVPGRRRHTHQDCTGLGRVEFLSIG